MLFEVFNITNHVNFLVDPNQGFNDIYTADNFGTPTQIVPNSQRQAEFGVRSVLVPFWGAASPPKPPRPPESIPATAPLVA